MKANRFIAASLLAAGLGQLASSHAEDVDLYAGVQSNGAKPNLLVLLDSSAAWDASVSFTCTTPDGWQLPANNDGKAVGFEQCALYNAIKAIGNSSALVGNINMGLMLFSTGSTNGGTFKYPASSPYTLPTMNAAGITAYTNAVKSLDRQADKANNAAVAATMNEAWAFYSGQTGPSGTSYAGSSAITSSCQKNFVVYIANANNFGKPQDNLSWGSNQALANAGATAAQQTEIALPAATNKYQSNWGDEWARFIYQTDVTGSFGNKQNVVTYTIIVSDGKNPEYVTFLKSMAAKGGGKSFVVNAGDVTALVQALLAIFNEVQAVNSVFSSASLPVSVNTQGTYLNQVYMGMFRPDPNANPRWLGNLKQYQFIYDAATDTLQLGDSTGAPAISSSGTGFISPNAISYWTNKDLLSAPDSTGGMWVNNPSGTGGGYDSPDGDLVEKGGSAQQIRLTNLTNNYAASPSSPRKLYTYCPSGSSCNPQLSDSANAFSTSNSAITASVLGGSAPVSISSISRSGNTATATTSSTHSYSVGTSVTITGATPSDYNGTVTINAAPDANHFSYSITETPPTTATGSYTATRIQNAISIISLTRTAPNNSGVAAVTATTSSAHGFSTGQSIAISGAAGSQYNGTATITSVPTSTSFTYNITVSESPALSATGGSATVGSSTWSISSISRTAGSTEVGITTSSDITSGNGNNKTWLIAAGNTVTISGTSSSDYNKTWTVKGNGKNGCTTAPNGSNDQAKFFCVTATLTYAPASPDSATGIVASPAAASSTITSLTRGASSISGSCPTAASTATATATTSAAHGLSAGNTVTIGCVSGSTCDTNYGVGQNFTVASVPSSTQFTYSLNTGPTPCATGNSITASTSSTIDRVNLINWIRGEDNFGDEASPGSPYTVRPSIHGDVLHSRPVVINYGDSTGTVVFYGANDGVFRAVNGNQTASIGSIAAGGELWGLVLPEFYSKLNRQRANSPAWKTPSTPAGIVPTPQTKDYFADGPTGVYQKLKSDGTTDKAYIYLSMRRGGRFIYALDVSTPTDPRVLWKKSYTDSGFSELGQTWSQPKIAMVKGHNNPVLIFGAGYDPAEDNEPPAADTMGRDIFVLDALTGTMIWHAASSAVSGMNYSFAADITLLDRDNDGKIDRLYAADVGGNIWRVDLEPPAGNTPSNWQVTKFAALGCDTGPCSSGTTPRKFFYPADVVPVRGSVESYDAVLIGSGDREHPLYDTTANSGYSVKNQFYMLKDMKTGKNGSGQTTITKSALFNATSATYDRSGRGYYINFATGEKAVNAPLTVAGYTYFGTNQPTTPDATSCTANLGTARGYRIKPLDGAFGYTEFQSGGLPPSPVAGLVNIVVNGTTRQIAFCTGCGSGGEPPPNQDCQSSIGGCKPKNDVSTKRSRTYWYNK